MTDTQASETIETSGIPEQPKQPKKRKMSKKAAEKLAQAKAERQARLESAKALLAELRERYPQAFFGDEDPEAVMPLALRIHRQLYAAGYNYFAVRQALGLYTASPAYLAALAEGKPRVGLDGEPVGEVTEFQRGIAKLKLENPESAKAMLPALELAGVIESTVKPYQKKAMPQIELTAIQAKVAFTIDSETFRAVLDVDSVGAKSVPVAIAADGKKYTAQLNPKSFRKAQAAFREAAIPVVSISGNLKGSVVESAGIQIFDKGAKAAV